MDKWLGLTSRLLEDFDPILAEKETAFQDILKILDKHFEHDDRAQLPADFDAYFGAARPNTSQLRLRPRGPV